MPTISNTLLDRNSAVMREEIGTAAVEMMAEMDPTFRDIIFDEMSVRTARANELGRYWEIKKRFFGSMTGATRSGHLSNHWSLFGDETQRVGNRLYTQSLLQTFPDPLDSANPRPYGLTMTVYSEEFSIPFTLGELQMEATPSVIRDFLTPKFKGFSKLIAHKFATAWFADQENGYLLGVVPAAGSVTYAVDATNGDTVRFVPTDINGNIATNLISKFHVGMPVDLRHATTHVRYNESGGSRIRCFVQDVDGWTGEITLVFAPGFTASAAGVADHRITWMNSYNASGSGLTAGYKGFYSWRDFFKFGHASDAAQKRILGSQASSTTDEFIDVDVNSDFKSGLWANVGALNERKLEAYLTRVYAALGRLGYTIDTLLGSEGISLNIWEQQIGREVINRDKSPGSVGGLGRTGGVGFQYTHPSGRTLRLFESQFLELGTMLGMRRKGNWEMVVVPDPEQVKRGGLPDNPNKIPLVFPVAALTGTNSNRFPILDGQGRLTEGTFIPCYARCQMVPREQIPGVVWTGITTSRVNTDT